MSFSQHDRISIGLTTFNQAKKMRFEIMEGGYNLFTEKKHVKSLKEGDVFIVHFYETKILIQKDKNIYIPAQKMNLIAHDSLAKFSVNALKANIYYPYFGDLTIEADSVGKLWINKLNIESYLPGVLRAEVGGMFDFEFLKVMATISRTYSLINKGKHEKKGFDLCEETHCQVYEGAKNIDSIFIEAVQATEGIVVVDSNCNLIDAVYHSNSGGISAPAEFAWNHPVEYLQSVDDPYSACGKKSYWEVEVNKAEWDSFLLQYDFHIPDSMCIDSAINRRQYFAQGDSNLRMKDLRFEFKLRSSLFEVMAYTDSTLLICGQGYGHGVGLPQEGAYEMGLQGFNYQDIIRYYYKGVEFVHLDVFKAPEPSSKDRK